MELHVVLPNESVDLDPRLLVDLSRRAEESGYAGVWLPDHLLPPQEYGGPYGGVYEPLVTLSHIAAATTRIRLGTSVLLLALRNPFVVAKQAATLDRLSGGRFTLGIGLGWDQAEFASTGADFTDRAGRTDESLRLLRHLFDHGAGPFEGLRFGFATGTFAPRPGPGLKIMVGGTSPAALRRAARWADLWQSPPDTPAAFAERVAALRAQAGRAVAAGARTEWSDSARPVEDIADEVRAWADAGADHLAVWFGDAHGFADRMTALASAGLS
ncbi:TIGR03619 family F420-dependent LLM class oxidoreductase [Streptomyces flaveolus]|uniref:TIGR03619 family F420-dependent LLM class oxidoreductase n=1 Tax=Streptomyces flaveolus TaxID=67297 RepID=UPI00339ECEC5